MHPEAFDFLRTELHSHRDRPVSVLELGSRDVNGSPRELFSHEFRFYWGIDIEDGPGVDEVANAATWSAARAAHWFDIVICAEVFEHTHEWPLIVRTAYQSLCSGGLALFTAACEPREAHSAVDGALLPEGHDEWYENVDPGRLADHMQRAGFSNVKISTHPWGDVYASGTRP